MRNEQAELIKGGRLGGGATPSPLGRRRRSSFKSQFAILPIEPNSATRSGAEGSVYIIRVKIPREHSNAESSESPLHALIGIDRETSIYVTPDK